MVSVIAQVLLACPILASNACLFLGGARIKVIGLALLAGHDTQHNGTLVLLLLVSFMLNVINAECRYAVCRGALLASMRPVLS
jgi:hypothetical protein